MIEGDRTHWLGPATEEQVQAAEKTLGETFPEEYRRFLLTHGCGLVDDVELFGLGRITGKRPDVLWLIGTIEELGLRRPEGVIPIAEVGNGDYVAVLASAYGDHGIGNLVYWSPRRDAVVDLGHAGSSLTGWLKS